MGTIHLAHLLVLLAGPPTVSDGGLTVQQAREIIDQKGPRAAVDYFFSTQEREDALADGISSGAEEWLDIAGQLRAVSDGAASEILVISLQDALPLNTAGVLRRVAAGIFSAHDACSNFGAGQIEDERPVSEILSLVDLRLAAVRSITEPRLRTARRECLSHLKELREIVASSEKQQ